MARVFISHAAVDRAVVTREIIELMRDHGIDVWFAEDDIATSRQWEHSILEGLKSCDWFLVALTPRAVKSEWVKDEVLWAIENRPERIVPVLLEECDLGELHIRLPRIQLVDFCNINDDARRRLLACWDVEHRTAARDHLRFLGPGDRYSIAEPLIARDFLSEYLGKDSVLNRSVLIKCDGYNRDGGHGRLSPITKEALATASLIHPAIPRVFDLAYDPEIGTYSVLEHIPGVSLVDHLKTNGPLPTADVVDLIESLSYAVNFANEHGVIHRNIKPASVVVTENRQIYLTNFIVAKIGDSSEDEAILGTPKYMAPEQIDGRKNIDCRVDVWGLGCLFYELLTGNLPFHRESLGQNIMSTLQSIRDDKPRPPRDHNGSIPKILEEICLKCLEKDPTQRYSTASDLAAALNNWRGRKGRSWPW